MEEGKAEYMNGYERIFVARQPIFTEKQEVWGYELLFRHSDEVNRADVLNPNAATAHVIADGYAIAQQQIAVDKFVLINFPQKLLLDGTVQVLPKAQCIPEILESISPTEEVLEACASLKAAGYQLALDDYVGEVGYERLLEYADIVKVDVLGLSLVELAVLANKLKRYGCRLLAEKVETKSVFQSCCDLGFSLFQGYYFSKPEVMSGRKVSSSQLVKMDVLRILGKDFDSKELAEILSRDVSLSYRLLKYINSPAFGLAKDIRTIEQAISLLGQDVVRNWLMVALLADINPTPQAQEITFYSVQRARFLANAAARFDMGYPPETMFMFGLFSQLDALMGTPMQELLDMLPFDGDMRDAYLDASHPLNGWLQNLEAIERGEAPSTANFFVKRQLPFKHVSVLFNEASRWTMKLLGAVRVSSLSEMDA